MPEYLTPEGLEKLKKELDVLKNVKRREVAEKLTHAISLGDLSENAAYTEAKESQAFLEGEIARIEGVVRTAVLITDQDNSCVRIGSTVAVDREGQEVKYRVVSPSEINLEEGKISYDSPLGKALLDKKAGDSFEFETPTKKFKCQILRIE